MCPLAACRSDVGYRSIEAFKCYCGSLLTPRFHRSAASSGMIPDENINCNNKLINASLKLSNFAGTQGVRFKIRDNKCKVDCEKLSSIAPLNENV